MEEETKPNRYFLAMYSFQTRSGVSYGQCDFTIQNGRYMNQKKCSEWILDQNKSLNIISKVIIYNIIELSEQEYNDWTL